MSPLLFFELILRVSFRHCICIEFNVHCGGFGKEFSIDFDEGDLLIYLID